MNTKLKILFLIFIVSFIVSCGPNQNSNLDKNGIETVENADQTISGTASSTVDKASSSSLVVIIVFCVIFVVLLPLFFWYFIPLGLWYEAWLSGVKVGWWKLIKMRFQKIPQHLILKTMIKAQNSGLKLKTLDMMAKYLAGVDIIKVTDTAIRAVNAGLQVSYNDLASQYLAKVDVETVMHALITAKNADLDVGLKELASYYLANVDVFLVIEALITAHNAGHAEFTINDLKEHYLANGNVAITVDAYVATQEAEYHDVTFKDIAAIDLAGIDVMAAVSSAVNPKVVETPTVTGVARDGVQLHMKLKLTLRANLKNMIGGATEDTVLARIDESLATEIGRAVTHYDILESPFKLADNVEKFNLGEGTAYDVISVDVSEITVGKDVSAELLTERAHAQAEKAKADLIKAEEKVQKAMASAFMDGKLSINDYHNIQNTEADTHMRKKIGDTQIDDSENEHDKKHDNH